MKNFVLVLFMFVFLSAKAQEVPVDFQEVTIESPEPGKCYFFSLANPNRKNVTLEKSFVIEIFSPKYEEVETTLYLKDFESEFEQSKRIRYQTAPAHAKFVRKIAEGRSANIDRNPNSFILCLVEVPPLWKTISLANFENGSMKIMKKELVEKAKVTKTYVDKKPNIITENQCYFQEGYSSKLEELILPTRCGGSYTIRNIQEKLIKLGYDIEANNILNEKTRFSLIHFQRKNGLKEGALDLKTLKLLGIQY